MGRDTYRYRALDAERAKRGQIDPVWRGIGCLLLVTLAVAGFGLGVWFVKANLENHWIYIPRNFYFPAIHPAVDRYLANGMVIKLVFMFFMVMFGLGIISVVYALMFPIQPGEFDAPPPKKTRLRKR